jgi:hypothetical protein
MLARLNELWAVSQVDQFRLKAIVKDDFFQRKLSGLGPGFLGAVSDGDDRARYAILRVALRVI